MKKFILITLLIISFSAIAKTNYGAALVSEVVSVYDADTFRVNIKGWPAVVGLNMPVRVNGIDAAEIRGKCPEEKSLAKQARLFTVNFLKGGTVELHNITRGYYFRFAADVFVNGKSLGDALIKAGHARFYDGKSKRAEWCK